ncbi:hypothetical protein GJ496_003970 [Pomphorhynchus laevis]|nr:hypothetical protein GJ496_003970 [Pomphorhynchus laevis]
MFTSLSTILSGNSYLKNATVGQSLLRLRYISNIPKTYNFREIEKSEICQTKCMFTDDQKKQYIILPPPNTTGNLHLGHTLNGFLLDMYCMLGSKKMTIVPGFDHAGIAAQTVVQKNLQKSKVSVTSKDDLFGKIKEWSDNKRITMKQQIRELGLQSIDWTREYYTLNMQQVVNEAFKRLYEDGLIVQDMRPVNWSPTLQSTVSDLEVVVEERSAEMYCIKYKLTDWDNENQEYVTVSTTRPETIWADVAIAVHPSDNRYSNLIGRKVQNPLTYNNIPIVADNMIEMEKGTGAVKITPAHNVFDYQLARRASLPISVPVMNKDGRLKCPEISIQTSRSMKLARIETVQWLTEQGLLESKTSGRIAPLPVCARTGDVLETIMIKQWYLDTREMRNFTAEIFSNGKIKIQPEYPLHQAMDWLSKNRNWCISRQIVWGHRIPVFYDKDDNVCLVKGADQINIDNNLRQDSDVLDTWFSSALIPLYLAGWPYRQSNFNFSSVLITGQDIMCPWVCRMVFLTSYLTNGELPFHKVFLHGLITDKQGSKMSKTKNNTIEPDTVLEKYGVDASRWALLSHNAHKEFVKLDGDTSFINGRKYLNKLWNAYRLLTINSHGEHVENNVDYNLLDQWMIHRVKEVDIKVNTLLAEFDTSMAISMVTHLFIQDFCSLYLECQKRRNNWNMAWSVFNGILCIHRPLIPFIVTYLQNHISRESLEYNDQYYRLQSRFTHEECNSAVDSFKEVISQIYKIKADKGLRNINSVTVFSPNSLLSHAFKTLTEDIAFISKANNILLKEHSCETLIVKLT